MPSKALIAAVVAVVLVLVAAVGAVMFKGGQRAAGTHGRDAAPGHVAPPAGDAARLQASETVDAGLAERLRALSSRAGGEVAVAVTHVETGRGVEVQGAKPLPLYSVFKLPLAVAVLKDVEEGRLRLDQKVRVEPEEGAPGTRANSDLWRKPVELTISQLLELSIVRSDNTSSDKMLELVGGPEVVTRRMRALGLQHIDIRTSVRDYAKRRENPNTGTASDLAQLLARLQKGEVLQPPQFAVLRGYMEGAVTGLKRLRGDLPAGTVVADKTGTGETVTNDVGLITLPEGRGHLSMAVFVSGSKLSAEAQEKLIAELARAAYDAHVPRPAQKAY